MINEERREEIKTALNGAAVEVEKVMSMLDPLNSEELQMLQRLDRIKGSLHGVVREPRVLHVEPEE